VPTNHTSTIAKGLGKFIYVVGTKKKFDFGSFVFDQTMKRVQSLAMKMHIAFPSIICGVILSQHRGILVSADVMSKRGSSLYKLFARTHVPDIVVTSGKEVTSSTYKEGIIDELKFMSKSLEESIKSSTRKKISVDKLIVALSSQKEDEDMAEGPEDVVGNAGDGNDDDQDE